jgi:hypothetical protein
MGRMTDGSMPSKARRFPNRTTSNVGESHERSQQGSDSNRVRDYGIYARNDSRILGAGWTDCSSRPLLHDVGHGWLRLQLYELCAVPSNGISARCGVLR